MPAGNKKKKKPAANPARGFATISTQSKSKVETPKESVDVSGDVTPDVARLPTESRPEENDKPTTNNDRELHELSPEELERQLEITELQQFVEKHAAKVRKDVSRQASRMQTEKRLLRGQADLLSAKQWLPDELMQLIYDYTSADLTGGFPEKGQQLARGDDLVAKVWSLRLVLADIEVSAERANEVIGHLLHHPPENVTSTIWGLPEALDWLALHCEPGEMLEYDVQRHRTALDTEDDEEPVGDGQETPEKKDSPLSNTSESAGVDPTEDDVDVSEIESDPEPEELISHYLRTKARLYEIDPSAEETKSRKKGKLGAAKGQTNSAATQGGRKLQRKLDIIERDVLFDQREAEAQWANKKLELVRATSERRKLELLEHPDSKTLSTPTKPSISRGQNSQNGIDNAGIDFHDGSSDSHEEDLLSGMFDALPGVKSQPADGGATENGTNEVTTRDFGRVSGIAPRRVLEETCRARDSRCKITYKQVSPTTYACRHSVSVEWAKEQAMAECPYLPSVTVKKKRRPFTITMKHEATPEVAQSEAYVATAALFAIFSDSPKEEKAHMRLPPAFRNLWDEFAQLKHEYADAADRTAVKELRNFIENHAAGENGDDDVDEVVFNASSRRLNGAASGTLTPTSRPQTPKLAGLDDAQLLQDTWARKVAAPSYQRMLLARMNLPMFHSKAVALDTIARNQVTIVVGDTGSGKSTQVPQFILENELSQGRQCKIYCTEPRRISAISLAQRVSEELGERKGDLGTARSLVGFAIRLESKTMSQTKLVYATVGIVLRMLENADGLGEITHLVLDEVHERSIDTDFLLIVLLSLMAKRPDLKVVLMSATVDAQKFSNYLNNAPIVTVPGRTFPVQAKFLEDAIELTGHTVDDNGGQNEGQEEDLADIDRDDKPSAPQQLQGYSKQTQRTLAKYDEYKIDHTLIVKLLEKVAFLPAYQAFSRAILIFMPGIAEIRQLNDMLLGHPSFAQGWRIHALHSSFSSEDQQAAFEIPPEGTRKIVIATNIAETGITIPDVTCVIDTGKHREMRFDERRQMSRLIQSFIARANAKQRRGRAGRVQEGICFHLFTRYRFEELMIDQQTPEMLRLSLQDLVMRVKICKLGNIEEALGQALDPPQSKTVRRAIDALIEVGALSENEQLTPLGSQLAKLPLDAQLGKLILFGATFGCLDFALTVAASLTSKSPFLSPLHAKKQADTVRLGFKRGDSDLLTLYNAYSAWRRICSTPGLSEFHFCNKNFLSSQNLASIEDLKAQLLTALGVAGFVNLGPDDRSALMRVKPGSRQRNFITLPEKYCKADADDTVASSVVAWSFYPKIVKQEGKGWRNVANNQSLALHPTSVNKHSMSPDINYLSFYSIMQSSSKYTNAQETTPVSDFALVLLAGEATFHMYAGVIVIDGNRLKFKVRDWKTMFALKMLRTKLREALARVFKHPGRELGDRYRRWMELLERIFEQRQQR
ncbi:hypothetical protein LTR37_012896 [Vermiconidia calcicola]|uniref:Uncharacterized protein n=1 Tax=Vermiconidia calcicola TaxID=1690605 RepID=A0ACC3MZ90_9PEZI|nr:hypothetical protein LTR37_012896 [Vermiconidia calcicola]